MFKNAGAKLTALAKIMFYIQAGAGVIGSLIVGISVGKGIGGVGGFFLAVLLIAIIGALSVFLAWISTIMLYAFGELCANVMAIREGMGYNAPQQENLKLGEMASKFSNAASNFGSSVSNTVSNAANQASSRFGNGNGGNGAPRQPRQQHRQQMAASQWICPNCGKPNGPENAFCTGCGCTKD